MEPTVTHLISKYLDWCGKHRSPRSLEWYEGHLNGFLAHLGDSGSMPAGSLKPYHVVEWIDTHPTWGDNYRGGAIVAIKRVYNWAEELGYVDSSPVRKLKKPPARRREAYMKPDDLDAILALLSPSDPFRDLVIFAWQTGARPQEVRHIEGRHVSADGTRITFPALESKGKRHPRKILLNEVARTILAKHLRKRPKGKVFRNTRGQPWSKFAVCNRMYRLSKKTGRPLTMYCIRHGRATQMLKNGVDHLTAAAILGHRNGAMLATVYSHVDDDEEYLRKALED